MRKNHDDAHARPVKRSPKPKSPRRVMRDTTAIYYQVVMEEYPEQEPEEWKAQAHQRAIRARGVRAKYEQANRQQAGVASAADEAAAQRLAQGASSNWQTASQHKHRARTHRHAERIWRLDEIAGMRVIE